ncbi:MAG TPA: hypothetical protein VGD99_13680 [Anaerolineae bacterium]
MKYIIVLLSCAFLLAVVPLTPASAGDPDKTVGGINPNHYVCVTPDHVVINLDSDAVDSSGNFDPDIEVDLEELEDDCDRFKDSQDARVELLRQSRLEGFVFEFHPAPNAPGGWQGVASSDVLVVASGPGFEIFWGSEKDGFYYFDYLGAGPVTLNLRLPPDAHPINPNITVVTDGFARVVTVPLGFYRGDTPPDDVEALRLPAGVTRFSTLPPADTIYEDFLVSGDDPDTGIVSGMPNVGGILPSDQSVSTIVLAVIMLAVLPAAGILKLRQRRSNEIER